MGFNQNRFLQDKDRKANPQMCGFDLMYVTYSMHAVFKAWLCNFLLNYSLTFSF